jgi:5-methylcytosine-specific restriction endonuclease McrA
MMPTKNAKPSKEGSRKCILQFLLQNVGRVLEKDEIRVASGNVSEWARRLRELRDEHGYQILSHKDRRDLKPGQYLLQTDQRLPSLPRGISKETRSWVYERNGYTCQMCGTAAGDPDEFHPGQKIRLTMGHIIDQSKGGPDTPDNLRAVCTNCNEGLQNTSPPKPRRIELLKQVRRATIDDQLHLLAWLEQRFDKIKPDKK